MGSEEWKVMEELGGRYSVSNCGRIKHNRTGNIRKERVSQFGYNRMAFHVTRTTTETYFIHRLVAKYFLCPDAERKFVNHKDGNKLNNHVSNLEWVTPKENAEHAARVGLAPRGEQNGQSKLKAADIPAIVRMYAVGTTQRAIAKIFNVSRGLIGHICRGVAWKGVVRDAI